MPGVFIHYGHQTSMCMHPPPGALAARGVLPLKSTFRSVASYIVCCGYRLNAVHMAVGCGCVDVVEYLATRSTADLVVKDESGRSVLIIAAQAYSYLRKLA